MPRSRTQKPRFPRPSKSGLTERIPKRRTHRGVLQGQAKDLFTCPKGAEGAPCPPGGGEGRHPRTPHLPAAHPPPRPHPGLALTLTALRLSSFTTPLLFPAPTPRVAVGLRSELLSSLDSGGLSGPRSGTSGLQGRQISFLGACFLLISVSSVLPGLTPYACDCLFSPEAALKEPHSEPGGGGIPALSAPPRSPPPPPCTCPRPTRPVSSAEEEPALAVPSAADKGPPARGAGTPLRAPGKLQTLSWAQRTPPGAVVAMRDLRVPPGSVSGQPRAPPHP